MSFSVIESTPGYLPENTDDSTFDDYADAVAYANERADELEGQGYECDRSWASRDNYYAIRCTETEGIARLGRTIEVVTDEGSGA